MNPVRVRFAPSPTGGLHIGGLRTALYNYLLARQTGGTMILRIEDTDRSRFVEGAEAYIQEALAWAGIQIQEGPTQGGAFGPYRQSERKEIYQQYVKELLDSGKAYYAFDSPEELEAMRQRQGSSGQYDHSTRLTMRNSLSLSKGEADDLVASGGYVVRMKVEPGHQVVLNDIIRSTVTFDSGLVDDKVLMKSDGMPTYHLANVVDDHLMEITHVIRGEEWLPSAPLHVLLYEAFGWKDSMPAFSHLPLLLKPDGTGKLSKRDAEKGGFPIFPLDWTDPRNGQNSIGYREAGYLPEALINFLALLGWNPGTEQELFSIDQLIQAFSLERIGKSGARFDILKAQWFNQQYLRTLDDRALGEMLQAQAIENGAQATIEEAIAIVPLLRERITFPSDLWKTGSFFYTEPKTFDQEIINKKWSAAAGDLLLNFASSIESVAITPEQAKEKLEASCMAAGMKSGQVLQLLRLFLTGAAGGPDLMMSIGLLGGATCARRIRYGVESASLR